MMTVNSSSKRTRTRSPPYFGADFSGEQGNVLAKGLRLLVTYRNVPYSGALLGQPWDHRRAAYSLFSVAHAGIARAACAPFKIVPKHPMRPHSTEPQFD
jgi:hypothetical protein